MASIAVVHEDPVDDAHDGLGLTEAWFTKRAALHRRAEWTALAGTMFRRSA